jgi:tetratricopeptide (TPR) repeat protein
VGAAQRFTQALHRLGPSHSCRNQGHHTLLAQLCSNRSAALAALGHHAGALLDAARAAHLAPGWGKAHLRMALALLQLGRAAAALQAARAGVEAEPGNEELASLSDTAQARLLLLLLR